MSVDKIDQIEEMTIHHGKLSNRVFILSIKVGHEGKIINFVENLAKEKGYSKIIAKVPEVSKKIFLLSGYEKEAYIKNLFNGSEDGYFLVKYLDDDRRIAENREEIEKVLVEARKKSGNGSETRVGREVKVMDKDDVGDMVSFYKSIFETYPFPIFDEEYLIKSMFSNVKYFGIEEKGKIIALSSIEIDEDKSYAELTDFAVDIKYRNRGLAQDLLLEMENALREIGIKMSFTIARAVSYGMNITFSKNGYEFGGTLYNNTNISGKIESMNIWYKSL